MKKIIKRSIVILMITTLLLSFNMLNIVNAVEDNTIQAQYEFEMLNVELKDSIKRSTYNKLILGNSNIDSDYDLSKKYDIIVKNQKLTNTCWAFAYTSAIETTLKDNKEYSPMHIAYKISDVYNTLPGTGGTFAMALSYAASESGPVYENDFTFESVYDEEKNSEDKYFLTDLSKISLEKYVARARIEDLSLFPQIYKSYNTSNNTITYKNTNAITISNKTYTNAEVNAIRDLVKQHIKTNGAVIASFYSDIGTTPDGKFVSLGGYYDSVNKSYYSEGKGEIFTKSPNHAVTIVGWDDTFSKEKFTGTDKPKNDGAYIVLNSYGEEFGDKGLFYVSYDDYAIEQQMLGINRIVKTNSSQDIKYKYEYDEIGMNSYISGKGIQAIYGANVFTKKDTKHIETLNEVGIYLDKAEGVEIYINPSDGDLSKCKLVGTYTGENALEAGYHILKLSAPVQLTGDQFVVKVKYINKESPDVPIEYNIKSNSTTSTDQEFERLKEMYKNAKSSAKESYISADNVNWNDLYTLTIGESTYKDSNICIKAFTTQGDEKVAVKGVTLNKTSLSVQVGDKSNLVATINPTNAINKGVKWTSSDTKVATVSDEGIITAKSKGTTTITVTTDDGKFTATCKVTVTEKKSSDDDIYKEDEKEKPKEESKEDSKDTPTKKEENDKPKEDEKEDKKEQKPQQEDQSKSKDPLPYTGVTSVLGIIAISGTIMFVIYRKTKKYKGI